METQQYKIRTRTHRGHDKLINVYCKKKKNHMQKVLNISNLESPILISKFLVFSIVRPYYAFIDVTCFYRRYRFLLKKNLWVQRILILFIIMRPKPTLSSFNYYFVLEHFNNVKLSVKYQWHPTCVFCMFEQKINK